MPDYASMDPLVLHLALVSGDVDVDGRRLVDAGAAAVAEVAHQSASLCAWRG